jgi:hypothetical protein
MDMNIRALQIQVSENKETIRGYVRILTNNNGLKISNPHSTNHYIYGEENLTFKFYSFADRWMNQIIMNEFVSISEDSILQTADNIKLIRKGLSAIEKKSGYTAFDNLDFVLMAYAKVLKCKNIVTLDKLGNVEKVFNLSLGCDLDNFRAYLKN